MSTDLRKIIVNATSEMLDEPGENGIYQTTRFYNRLESEVQEYIDTQPNPINVHELVLETVKNSSGMNMALQSAVANYIEYLSHPKMTINPVNLNLGKELE